MKMCENPPPKRDNRELPPLPSHRWHVPTVDCEDFLKQTPEESNHLTDCPWTGHISAKKCCN